MPDLQYNSSDTISDPEVRKWVARIRFAKNAHEREFAVRARRNVQYYVGNQYQTAQLTGRVPLNFIASTVDIIVPAVYSRDPQVIVRPKILDKGDPEQNKRSRDLAKMFESLIDKTMQEIKLKETMKEVIRDATLMGRGYVKLGYDAIKGVKQGRKFSFAGKIAKLVGVPIDQNVMDEYIKQEKVWAERVSPFKFFYDPECVKLPDARWCIHETTHPLQKVKDNPRYKNRTLLGPSSMSDPKYLNGVFTKEVTLTMADKISQEVPVDLQRITLFEIWDKDTRKIYVLASSNEDLGFIREDDWPFDKVDGFPFRELMPLPVPDSQWGAAEVDRIIEGQDEFNLVRDMMSKHTARAMAGWMVQTSAIDKDHLQKWLNGDIMEFYEVKDINGIKSFLPPNMPADYFAYAKSLKDDLAENSKIPDWRRAGESMRARSATEAVAISQGFDVVTNERVDVVQDFSQDVIRVMVQIMQEKYRMDHAVRMTGEQGLSWREFRPQEVKEELDISIMPYSATPVTPDRERAQYLQFAPLVQQALQMGIPVNYEAFLEKLAEKLQISDYDEFLGAAAMAGAENPAGAQAVSQLGLTGPGGMAQPQGGNGKTAQGAPAFQPPSPPFLGGPRL